VQLVDEPADQATCESAKGCVILACALIRLFEGKLRIEQQVIEYRSEAYPAELEGAVSELLDEAEIEFTSAGFLQAAGSVL
jgi:hypothetical protein